MPGKPIGEIARNYGLKNIIKLASNENPLGPPEESLAAIQIALAALAQYPDGSAFSLKAGLADYLKVAPQQLTVGNGSNEILSLVAETFLRPGDEAVFSEYAFVVYGLAVQATGGIAQIARANDPEGPQPLGHGLQALEALISPRTRLVFIANPNNPTGTWLPRGIGGLCPPRATGGVGGAR